MTRWMASVCALSVREVREHWRLALSVSIVLWLLVAVSLTLVDIPRFDPFVVYGAVWPATSLVLLSLVGAGLFASDESSGARRTLSALPVGRGTVVLSKALLLVVAAAGLIGGLIAVEFVRPEAKVAVSITSPVYYIRPADAWSLVALGAICAMALGALFHHELAAAFVTLGLVALGCTFWLAAPPEVFQIPVVVRLANVAEAFTTRAWSHLAAALIALALLTMAALRGHGCRSFLVRLGHGLLVATSVASPVLAFAWVKQPLFEIDPREPGVRLSRAAASRDGTEVLFELELPDQLEPPSGLDSELWWLDVESGECHPVVQIGKRWDVWNESPGWHDRGAGLRAQLVAPLPRTLEAGDHRIVRRRRFVGQLDPRIPELIDFDSPERKRRAPIPPYGQLEVVRVEPPDASPGEREVLLREKHTGETAVVPAGTRFKRAVSVGIAPEDAWFLEFGPDRVLRRRWAGDSKALDLLRVERPGSLYFGFFNHAATATCLSLNVSPNEYAHRVVATDGSRAGPWVEGATFCDLWLPCQPEKVLAARELEGGDQIEWLVLGTDATVELGRLPPGCVDCQPLADGRFLTVQDGRRLLALDSRFAPDAVLWDADHPDRGPVAID